MKKYISINKDNFINQMKYHKYLILKEIIICKLKINNYYFYIFSVIV